MTIEELIVRARSQPIVEKTRVVNVPGPELKALISSGKPLLLSDLYAHPDQTKEARKFRYGHLLGPGLPSTSIMDWQLKWLNHALPNDLVDLLQRVNGIHLWADIDFGRSYYGILPLAEWEDAGAVIWKSLFETPPQGHLVISYHDNGDYYLVLDTRSSEYRWHDLGDFDKPLRIGSTVTEVLDWLWQESDELNPVHEQ